MPAWPDFSAHSKPLGTSAQQHRPPPRSDRAAVQALRWWYSWKRQNLPAHRRTSIVETVIAGLDQREQQMVDAWLGGAYDKTIAERLEVLLPLIAQVRLGLLSQVALRLAGAGRQRVGGQNAKPTMSADTDTF